MSALTTGCVLVQFIALIFVLTRIRGRLFAHVGAIFITIAFIFHGVSEIANATFPEMNLYRKLVREDDIETWLIIVTASICVFAVSYVIVIGQPSTGEEAKAPTNVMDWRTTLIFVVPAYFVAVTGGREETIGYLAAGFSDAFVIIGIVLTSTLYLLNSRGKNFIYVILAQSLATALLGQRLYIVVSIVILFSILSRYQIPIDMRKVGGAFALTAFLVIAISSARAVVGREGFSGEASERFNAMQSGATGIASRGVTFDTIASDFVYRIDGNAFPAILNQRMSFDRSPAGADPVINAFFLAIPRFMSPNKMSTDLAARNEKYYLQQHFALPDGYDYLPMTLGMVFGCFGPAGPIGFGFLAGIGLARLDIWLRRAATPAAILLAIGFTYCAVFMEQGITVYTITFRAILVILVASTFFSRILRFDRSSTPDGRGQPR